MRPSLDDVARQKFDVVVIGGGINGTGIAREVQRRGYRTLLVERDDFGAGTTARATRLIHGGLRYLEHGEFALVYESLGEREALVRDAAHLVRPLRMLVPVYAGDERPPWKVRAGLLLYDLLSFRKTLPRHRAISRRELATYEPGLNHEGLRAAFLMSDAQLEFPERIVADTLRDFLDDGGVALNHTGAERLVSPGGVLRSIVLRDRCGAEAEVACAVAVNAAGPWADAVLRGSDAERHEPLIGGTKGSHLVAEWPDGPKRAIFASAKSDGRPFFILPWYRYTLIGTTDLRYDGDPSDARCTADELQYLLDEASRLFPRAPLARGNVLYTYSGIRPLPYTTAGEEAAITRSHFVVDHAKRGGPKGLLSVVGGKLTTYRSLSRSAAAAIEKLAPLKGDTTSVGTNLKGSPLPPSASSIQHPAPLGGAVVAELQGDPLAIYGRRKHELHEIITADPGLGEPICQHNPDMLAQVAYAVEREHAVTLADVLLRRTPAGWSKCHALDGLERAATVMAKRLGWPEDRVIREIEAYKSELRATLVPVEDIEHDSKQRGEGSKG